MSHTSKNKEQNMADDNVLYGPLMVNERLNIYPAMPLDSVFDWLKEIFQENHPCRSRDANGTLSFNHQVRNRDGEIIMEGTRLRLHLSFERYQNRERGYIEFFSDDYVIAEFSYTHLTTYFYAIPEAEIVDITYGGELSKFLQRQDLDSSFVLGKYVNDYHWYAELFPISQVINIKSAKKI